MSPYAQPWTQNDAVSDCKVKHGSLLGGGPREPASNERLCVRTATKLRIRREGGAGGAAPIVGAPCWRRTYYYGYCLCSGWRAPLAHSIQCKEKKTRKILYELNSLAVVINNVLP